MNRSVLLLCFAFLCLAGAVTAFSGSGAGTLANPFVITNCAQLQEMQDAIAANYTLSNDIDCSDTVNWNSGAGFKPITATYAKGFKGSLKGQGYTISGLYISNSSIAGLFGYTLSAANITNFKVTGARINGTEYVGGIVAYSYGSLSYVYFEGNISTISGEAGGIVGVNDGPISYCHSKGNFTATSAGMIGLVFGDSIDALSSVTNCYAEGSVTGAGQGVGGFSGRNYGTISNSYTRASTRSTDTNIGGFVGTNYGTVSKSYSMGNVTGSNPYYTCGFADTSGTVSGSYHDSQTGLPYYTGSYCSRTEKTTAQMRANTTYTNWDFTSTWNISTDLNDGYPFLVGFGNISPSVINVSIKFPLNGSNYSNVNILNYTTTTAANLSSCWYTNSSGLWNSSNVTAKTNFTQVSSSEGLNTFTIYCNSSNNIGSSSVSFTIDITPPTFHNISSQTLPARIVLSHKINATDPSGISCYSVNDTARFSMNCSGYLKNNTILNQGLYDVNVSANDTLGNVNSTLILVNVTPASAVSLQLVSPTGNMNATQNQTFQVTANVSCLNANCGQVNASLVNLLPTLNIIQNRDFEVVNLSGWTRKGAKNWTNDSSTVRLGTYSAKSGAITHSQSTTIEQNITLPSSGTLNFVWKVSSEGGWDYLGFCVNKDFGVSGCTRGTGNVTAIAGNVDWTRVSVNLPAGTSQLLWYYAKDASGSSGSDAGWVDNVTLSNELMPTISLVNTTAGATPFRTTTNNPYNLTLNNGESGIITWTVNATGAMWSNSTLFIHANMTSDMAIGNSTGIWNVTIINATIDVIPPVVSVIYPLNNTNYTINVSWLNYTVADAGTLSDCWRSNSSGMWNSTTVTAGANFSGAASSEGWNNWTVYCNDTSNNVGSGTVTFFKDSAPPSFTSISNQTNEYGTAFSYDLDATDSSGTDCFSINDTANFQINCSGYMANNTLLSIRLYQLNTTVNDTFGNTNSALVWVNVSDTTAPIINVTYPFNNTNYTINISWLNYTVADNGTLSGCWRSNSSGAWNSTTAAAGTNFSDAISSEGWNNWTVYCNDTSNNVGQRKATFYKDTTPPEFSNLSNLTIEYGSALNHSINATDASGISCFLLNDTARFNITCLGSLTNDTILPVSLYWLNITANDTLGNNNTATLIVNITDTTPPMVILRAPAANFANDSARQVNITFNCSSTDNFALASMSLYLTDNQSANFSLNQTYAMAGTSNSTNWTLRLSNGNYTWNCLANDSSGNHAWAANNRTIILNFTDTDGDDASDSQDSLEGNESSVNTTGISRLNISIGGNSTYGSYSGEQPVIFYDLMARLINFTHNFSASELDLRRISVNKSANWIIINLSGQVQANHNKTVYVSDNNFVSLCVKDAEISTIENISAGCSEANETDFTSCLGGNATLNAISCLDEGSTIAVSNLRYSAIKGTPAIPSSPPSSSSSGGGGGGGGGSLVAPTATKKEPEKDHECTLDSHCKADKACYNHQCLKLFDIKIIRVDSPVGYDGYLSFDYFVKGMADISGDVTIKFWLEREGRTISSGQDVIYLGKFEERTEKTKIFIPKNLENSSYEFYVQVNFERYNATSHRTVYAEKKEDLVEVTLKEESLIEKMRIRRLIYPSAITILVLALVIIIILTARKSLSGTKQNASQRINYTIKKAENALKVGNYGEAYALYRTICEQYIALGEKKKAALYKRIIRIYLALGRQAAAEEGKRLTGK